jgi:hypothetical protein
MRSHSMAEGAGDWNEDVLYIKEGCKSMIYLHIWRTVPTYQPTVDKSY